MGFIIVVSFKAFQGAGRFAYLGFRFRGYDVLTNHEDPLFMGDLIIMLMGMIMFGAREKQRKVILWLLPLLLLGFYSGQRRAAYGGFAVAIVLFVVMLDTKKRIKLFKVALPLLILAGAYTAVFWNDTGRAGAVIQLIKSGFSDTRRGAGQRYYSNLGRQIERYDLATTVRAYPVDGVGFGKKYLQPINLNLGISPWSLRSYIPHNEILWLLVKMGAIGFFIFWLFIDALVFEAARLGRILKDPYLRSIAFMIATALGSQMVASYFDLQLTYYRNMILLGTLCGLLPTLKALDKEQSSTPGQSKDANKLNETVTGKGVPTWA